MAILHEYGINSDKKMRYNMMESQTGTNLSDMIGQTIEVKAYIIAEATNADGEIVKSLKIMTKDGDICGTRSASFIGGVERYIEYMETDEIDTMTIAQATSKAGRKYLQFIA